MIRFRTHEDERRYNALLTEVYLRLAQALGPTRPDLVGDILRNFAKVQQLVYLEGMRQGAIASNLEDEDNPREFSATLLHRRLYGNADTPLSHRENAFRDRHCISEREWALCPLFSTEPIEFAPTTLAEAEAALRNRPAPPIAPAPGAGATPAEPVASMLDYEGETPEDSIKRLARDLRVDPQKLDRRPYPLSPDQASFLDGFVDETGDWTPHPAHARPPAEMPAKLEMVRDAINTMLQSGWKPTTYEDVIRTLYQRLCWDAAFLDMVLATPLGRTVLDQCGLIHIGVPLEVDATFLQERPR